MFWFANVYKYRSSKDLVNSLCNIIYLKIPISKITKIPNNNENPKQDVY